MASAIEPSCSVVRTSTRRAPHTAVARHEQHQAPRVRRRVRATARASRRSVPEQQRAVAAVQEVGVTAVLRVDLDERVTVVGRRAVQLRAPTFDPLQRQLTEVEPGGTQGRGHDGRRRPPVRRPERDQHGGTHARARTAREEQLGHAATSGDRHRDDQAEQREVARTLPRAREPRLADDGRRRDARDEGE